jgi:hypothetical protein
MTNYEPSEELVRLLTVSADGSASAEELIRLEEILRSNADARGYYLDFMGLHATLVWNVADVLDQQSTNDEPETSRTAAGPEAGRTSVAQRPTPLVRPVPWRTLAWASTALSVALILLVGFVMWSVKPAIMARAVVPAPPPNSAASVYAANLTGDHNVVWGSPESQPNPRARLLAGQWLDFSSGLVEVTFVRGAVALVEGPARFRIIDDNSALLVKGKLCAEVPETATGFTVSTPSGEIIDLGTRFGVVVNDGTTQTHVFKGEVRALPNVRGDRGEGAVRLVAGEAATMPVDRGELIRGNADAERFAQQLPQRLSSVKVEDAAAASRKLIAPVSAKSSLGESHGQPARMIDGSGLVGNGPELARMHRGTELPVDHPERLLDDSNNWKAPASYLPIDLEFDLGEAVELTRFHVWNYAHPAPGIFAGERDARHVDLWISKDGVHFEPAGSIELTGSTAAVEPVQSYPLTCRARYVRLRLTSFYGGGHGSEVGLGEVRFERQ